MTEVMCVLDMDIDMPSIPVLQSHGNGEAFLG